MHMHMPSHAHALTCTCLHMHMRMQARTMGKDLQRLVTKFNELRATVVGFDAELRAADVMGLPKV